MKDKIIKNIDINYIHELTKELSLMGCDNGEYGFRVSGSTGEWHASNRIEAEMKAIGLKEVTVHEFPVESWEFRGGKLKFDDQVVDMSSYCGIKGTPKEGITAEIVFVGKGGAKDYEGINIKDKIAFATFDVLEDSWISLPAYEAELRGAKGLLISYAGDMYGTKGDAINCFDSQFKHTMPVGSISRNTAKILREKLDKGSVIGTMNLDITLNRQGKSSNVTGYIPGEDDKMIMFAGHMDGFFHSYQDDLLGVGIILGIAKAMIASGYKPKHTMVFTAHGSEEYGITESRYDWCIGSWNNINKIHPEWFGKMIAFFNIDAIRPGTPVYNIASTPEYHGFFKEFMENMEVPVTSWPGGKALIGLNGPWSDDFNYAINGVPGIICGRGPAEWSYQNYHTQGDCYTIFEEEREIVQYVAENYVDMTTTLDDYPLPPLNYKYALEELADDIPKKAGEIVDCIKAKICDVATVSDALYSKLREKPAVADPTGTRLKLMEIYRLIERDIYMLDPWDSVIFGHSQIAMNIDCLKAAKTSVEVGDMVKAVKDLWDLDLFRVSYDFSEETYRWLLDLQDYTRDDLFWGTNKIHQFVDTWDLSQALMSNDKAKAIAEIDKQLAFEEKLLADRLEKELGLLEEIENRIKEIEI